MARLGAEGVDLFGDPDDEISAAENYSIGYVFIEQEHMRSRAEWCFANMPMYDRQMLEMEDAQLLDEALRAYVFGLYAVVIIAASAFCERLLSDAIESQGDRKSAGGSLGKILKSWMIDEILHPYILRRIKHLHEVRNNFCHERDGDHPYRIFRRAYAQRAHHTMLLRNDAREGLCIMRGLAAQLPRQFPRLRVDGVGELSVRTARTAVK